MGNRFWGEEYRTTLICIDTCEAGRITGRYYNPYMEAGDTFGSLMHLLKKLEQMMDEMALPQAVNQRRSFLPVAALPVEPPQREFRQNGAAATFSVQIRYRQNSSWQGTVTWLENREERHFRSTLELLMLMDSALSGR